LLVRSSFAFGLILILLFISRFPLSSAPFFNVRQFSVFFSFFVPTLFCHEVSPLAAIILVVAFVVGPFFIPAVDGLTFFAGSGYFQIRFQTFSSTLRFQSRVPPAFHVLGTTLSLIGLPLSRVLRRDFHKCFPCWPPFVACIHGLPACYLPPPPFPELFPYLCPVLHAPLLFLTLAPNLLPASGAPVDCFS